MNPRAIAQSIADRLSCGPHPCQCGGQCQCGGSCRSKGADHAKGAEQMVYFDADHIDVDVTIGEVEFENKGTSQPLKMRHDYGKKGPGVISLDPQGEHSTGEYYGDIPSKLPGDHSNLSEWNRGLTAEQVELKLSYADRSAYIPFVPGARPELQRQQIERPLNDYLHPDSLPRDDESDDHPATPTPAEGIVRQAAQPSDDPERIHRRGEKEESRNRPVWRKTYRVKGGEVEVRHYLRSGPFAPTYGEFYAWEGDRAVGWLNMNQPELPEHEDKIAFDIEVSPQARRRGIASKLLQALRDRFRREPIPSSYAFPGDKQPTQDAQNLWQSQRRAGKRSDKEKDEIYKKWRELINMGPKELEDWAKNPDRLKASLNREEAKGGVDSGYDSLHRIKRRVSKKRSEWTDADYDNAAQENSFNSRMIGNDPGDPVGDTGRSKWEISLRNWGHSPSKASSPAHSKWKAWKNRQKKAGGVSVLLRGKKYKLVKRIDSSNWVVEGIPGRRGGGPHVGERYYLTAKPRGTSISASPGESWTPREVYLHPMTARGTADMAADDKAYFPFNEMVLFR